MDDVLEENATRHALKEQQEMSLKYRNIGIGIMGLADALVMMGLRYGSQDAVFFTELVMKLIFREAVFASVKLGKEKGNFPGYSPKVWDSRIIKKAFIPTEIAELKKKGTLRNCSLISIAPTGLN
jgi:ribonucleoside-diphosphate reductase alpha chain